MKDSWVTRAVMWVSVSAAVCLSIYFTKSSWAIWAFLLPALVSVSGGNSKDKK